MLHGLAPTVSSERVSCGAVEEASWRSHCGVVVPIPMFPLPSIVSLTFDAKDPALAILNLLESLTSFPTDQALPEKGAKDTSGLPPDPASRLKTALTAVPPTTWNLAVGAAVFIPTFPLGRIVRAGVVPVALVNGEDEAR